MKHLGTKRIETDRLILRRFTLEDAQAMYDNWASDDEVTKFLTWPTHASVDVSRMVLENWTASYAREDYYQWAIVFKEYGPEPIGCISVVGFDAHILRSHIGYCIGRRWWRRGIMTEALGAVMDFLFDEVGVLRVDAAHDVNNPNSGAVMAKCGMKCEGTLRRTGINNLGICDMRWYGMLAEERKEMKDNAESRRNRNADQ